ncbi:hypothetical protein [Methylobacterium durans]|uniref:hypothetical protein n=1 Tax=Methylobacterium durans TaxID=2202825 RepID=UPI0013A5709C|nr:hypothetical protein [Methylobacterium durans]
MPGLRPQFLGGRDVAVLLVDGGGGAERERDLLVEAGRAVEAGGGIAHRAGPASAGRRDARSRPAPAACLVWLAPAARRVWSVGVEPVGTVDSRERGAKETS